MAEKDGLRVDIIGDSGPFSRLGKSIGYRIRAGDSEFLFDCGAPIFKLLGPEGLAQIEGIIVSHSHEDHKRWFTDIALFQKFSSDTDHQLPLHCTYKILDELRTTTAYALEQTLSAESNRVINLTFEDYFEPGVIGPEPRYRCKKVGEKPGEQNWVVVDREGNRLPPDRAKVFKPPQVHRPRMLFKDPREEIWVEPETYYAYTDERFYVNESDSPTWHHDSGLAITPIKATAWHGPVVNAYLFEYEGEQIFFSSDTYYNPELWESLTEPLSPKKNAASGEAKEKTFLRGEINDYLEKIWSEKRLNRALSFYREDLPTIHDVSGPWAKVHTSYEFLEDHEGEILLTHSPDEFTSLHPLAHFEKSFRVQSNEFLEETEDGQLFPLKAACYHKRFNRYFIGIEDESGDHLLVKKQPGVYDVIEREATVPGSAEVLESIKLYEDINGEYFPVLTAENEEYYVRPDGQVEHQVHTAQGTEGEIVKNQRKLYR